MTGGLLEWEGRLDQWRKVGILKKRQLA